MNAPQQRKVASKPTPTRQPLARVIFNLLSSVKFAVATVALIGAACVLGTILPQGQEAIQYVNRFPAAAGRMQFFSVLGLTHLFSFWWFVALLCVLAASVTACTMRRFGTVRHTTGPTRRRAIGSMLTHISMLLILSGAVIRTVWGQKGFIELREGQTIAHFQNEKGNQPLPFAISLTQFQIETEAERNPLPVLSSSDGASGTSSDETLLVQWSERKLSARLSVRLNVEQTLTPRNEPATSNNTFRVTVLKYVPDFTIDTATREVTSRSSEPNNPAILVAVNGPDYRNHTWVFAKFPDFTMHTEGPDKPSPLRLAFLNKANEPKAAVPSGPVKNYKSTVKLLDGGGVAQCSTIAVNSPLKYKGYTFYQTGYNPEDLSWTSLQVVRDPGVPIVYAGFLFLIAGLFVVFYLNPWLSSRKAIT